MSGAGNTSTTQQNPNPNPQVIRYGPKYTMNPPPVLGVNCPWNTWFRKIQSQAKAHKWGPMLVSKTDMLDEWDIAKNWLLEAVPDEDFDLVDQAVCWMDAIEALKKAHSIVDEVNEVNLIEKLFSLTLLPNESVTSIISRCRAINSTLKSIKSGVTDRQLLSAVMKVMRQNPAYDSVLKTMVSLTGTTMDLDSLQTAFNNVAPPPIPGAFFVKDTPVVDPPPSKPLARLLCLQMAMEVVIVAGVVGVVGVDVEMEVRIIVFIHMVEVMVVLVGGVGEDTTMVVEAEVMVVVLGQKDSKVHATIVANQGT